VWTNAAARPGDALVLTKPLGTGVLATAAKADMFAAGMAAATVSMATLNRVAAETAQTFDVHACTDITGFGLLGHLYEMTSAAGVRAEVDARALPLFPEALEAAAMGLVPGGAYANREYLGTVRFASGVAENLRDLCFDPQTSGGLLFALPANEAPALAAALYRAGIVHAAVIGRITTKGEGEIDVYGD
jgi:selenide,water dikinase